MGCPITLTGMAIDCAPSMGGIRRVYIADHNTVAEVNETAGKVTAISMVSEEDKFKRYDFRKSTGETVQTLNKNEEAGTSFVTTDVTLVFTRMETAKRVEISALAQGQLAMIVEDCNGALWYVGKDYYAHVSAGSGNTGKAAADSNNYTLTISADSKDFIPEVDPSVLAEIL